MKKRIILLVLSLVFVSCSLVAQEEKERFTVDFGAELVTSYVWRGITFDPSLSIQPWSSISAGGFTFGTWGSFNTSGTYVEPDFYFSYAKNNFTATLFDFHAGLGNDFFNYKRDETQHIGEFSLQYSGTENFPIKLLASALLYGADKKIDHIDPQTGNVILSAENNYSLYFELGYSHTMKNEVSFDVFAGIVPVESNYYSVDKFAFINVGVEASKCIKINENFPMALRLSVITNPDANKVFYVFGISI